MYKWIYLEVAGFEEDIEEQFACHPEGILVHLDIFSWDFEVMFIKHGFRGIQYLGVRRFFDEMQEIFQEG